jgi:anti-sigma factor RsiW
MLGPLIDGELFENDETNLKKHMAQCPHCEQEFTEMLNLRDNLKKVEFLPVPDSLRKALKIKINKESEAMYSLWSFIKSKLKTHTKPLLTHAGATVFGALLVYIIILQPFKSNSLHTEIFNAHINSLAGNNLIAVKSQNTHTVKPWFAGKIKFSPHVPDLKYDAFILLGARIDHLQGEDFAVLVYIRNKHKINVFVSPAKNHTSLKSEKWHHSGYNVINWNDKTFNYTVISDLSTQGLEKFTQTFVASIKD